MIDVADLRIFVCTTPTRMNYSFDSLMGRDLSDRESGFSERLLVWMLRRLPQVVRT